MPYVAHGPQFLSWVAGQKDCLGGQRAGSPGAGDSGSSQEGSRPPFQTNSSHIPPLAGSTLAQLLLRALPAFCHGLQQCYLWLCSGVSSAPKP